MLLNYPNFEPTSLWSEKTAKYQCHGL